MQNDNNINQKPTENDIVLIWAKTLWNGRRTAIKTITITGAIGVVLALFTPKEYVSWTSVVPQTTNPASKLGGISSLAAMAGFNLDLSGGEELSPAVFPQIVGSVPYQLELMNIPFRFSGVDRPVTLYTYYSEIYRPGILHSIGEYTIGLPGKLINAFKGENTSVSYPGRPLMLSSKQEKIRKLIAKRVTLDVDPKRGYITLLSTFPEAELSAEVADQARELLQKYVTGYKIKKATDQLSFIDERYREKKKEFLSAQEKLARFRDQNKNVSSALAATEEERLRSEYTIAQSVYNELSKQLEQAKIQVKEDTPVFSVIQPAIVPQKPNAPQKIMIITIFIFLGLIISIGLIIGKPWFRAMKQKWEEVELIS